MKRFSILVVTAALVAACGGKSSSEGQTGGTAGAGATSSGGVGGSGAVGGTGAVGGGGVSGSAGAAGSGGADTCSADQKSKATLGGPQVGFDALPGTPGGAVVTNVTAKGIELSLGADGSPLLFKWVGPDLTSKFKKGESVGFGEQDQWSYVSGDAWTAVAFRDFGFVAPQEIPPMPNYGPHLSYGVECTFMEGGGACGQPPAAVTLLSVDATTGAGVVSIGQGKTGELVSWQIYNANSAQFPGYSSNDCVLEAGFASVITAVGPSLDTTQ